jgi:hypothetical protein
MANPQPTDPHLRIAHAIHEQIMISGFTEHEIKILLFILRLSWGCGRHSAYIPRQKDFELIGVGENHIKMKLADLIHSRVILRDGCRYEFNKDYDDWRIGPSRTYTREKLSRLIGLNLKTEDKDLRKREPCFNQSPQNGTAKFPKQEENSSARGKLVEPEPAWYKENINKNKNSNIYINANTGEEVEVSRISQKEAADIWTGVLLELRSQVSAANFRVWLSRTTGLGYTGNDFFVGAASVLVAEQLSSHMRSRLEKTLIQVSRRAFAVSFLIISPVSESEESGL